MVQSRRRTGKKIGWLGTTMALTIGLASPASTPVLAAETITAQYGLFMRSLSVESLKTYAETGQVDSNLQPYLDSLTPKQQDRLRQILVAKIEVSPTAVGQFLYTEPGKVLLQRLGNIVRSPSGLSGFHALRGAIILAAASPDGLSLINVLEHLPLRDMRVNLGQVLDLANRFETLVSQSQSAIATIQQQVNQTAATQSLPTASNRPNLQSPGPDTWQKLTISADNAHRGQSIPADIYLPADQGQPVTNAPLVVISHGLGGDRSTFAYVAQHLASYGFAVAVPEHPGSDSQRLAALLSGEAKEITEPSELINRPLDVSAVLDKLSDLAQSDSRFRGRIDLQRVGVMGQSYGGYTTLALAGATPDWQGLTQACADTDSLNLALLLECRALELSRPVPSLRDNRVKAIMAIDPVGASLFGETGMAQINIPTLIMGGSSDTVAPLLLEQIRPFTWLGSDSKYLAVLQNGTHFSTLAQSHGAGFSVDLPPSVIGPNPEIAAGYVEALGLAFFETHVAQNPDYATYLSPAYSQTISRAPMPLLLVRSLNTDRLEAMTQP